MKISYNWLKQYAPTNLPVSRVSELLTDSGLEVEGVETFSSVKGGFEGLVVGHVVEAAPHPNADRLKVTKVSIGNDTLLDIVCGAPNVAAGQKVVVAGVGTTLYPTDGEPFKIKKGKIRGEVSMGMICAEDEIGVGTDHEGIIVLDEKAAIGAPVSGFLPIEIDQVIEIGLTPNRAEAASHIGTARDLVALSVTSQDLDVTNIQWPSVEAFSIDNNDLPISVNIENKEACRRYAGVSMTNIKVESSPEWLQNRLKAIGLSPINNIVDISNYVLHEVGQPLHIFDADKISGNEVIIKTLAADTPFITLDEQERKLDAHDLMICNSQTGMCIAGVFGGIDSGVSESTKNIFIESANFDPVWIRKTAKRHGLNTDASFRFERGVDPEITVYALKRAALLIKEIAGGSVSSNLIDEYPKPLLPNKVALRYSQCDRIIGKKIDHALIRDILDKLGIKIVSDNGDDLMLEVPLYRVDVTREIDVIEEILRIYGYNNVEIPEQYRSSVVYLEGADHEAMLSKVSDHLTSLGFLEAKANSLTASDYYEKSEIYPISRSVRIKNPLSKELNVMRQTLLFNALEAVRHNQNRQTTDLKLYEFGKVYWMEDGKVKEQNKLSIVLTGQRYRESWIAGNDKVTFSDLKGYAASIVSLLNYRDIELEYNDNVPKAFDYGIAGIYNGQPLFNAGKISDALVNKFQIKQEVIYFEMNWDLFYNQAHDKRIKYKPIPKYPSVRRDLSLLLNQVVEFADIKEIALKTERKLLIRVNLFDVYEGKNLPEGKKSYAVSFVFQDSDKTLRDKQVDKMMAKILNNLQKELGAELRG